MGSLDQLVRKRELCHKRPLCLRVQRQVGWLKTDRRGERIQRFTT
jgi:hypothetical protein